MSQKTSIHRVLEDCSSKKSVLAQEGGDAKDSKLVATGPGRPNEKKESLNFGITCRDNEARSRCLKEEVAGWADRSRMHGGAESACVACAQGRIWGAAHRGAGLVEQVEGGASTLAHLGHAEAAAVAPLALEEVDLARQTPTRSRRAWLQMMTLIAIEIYKICEHIGAAICYIFT